jgi:hypothetical protein
MQYTARPEQHAGAAPLVPQLLNAECKQSQYPQGLPLAPAVAADKLQPMTGASWVAQFTRLAEEIQVRHYSPKTLKTYRQWLRQFQAFTRSKPPESLSAADVKEFLTWLAVKKEVAASTQNQAFNA